MNTKAQQMIKMPIYLIISIVVGAMVIIGFISITNRAMANTVEEITAKDIGLTIMTISAAPYNVVYRYDKNTEDYEIKISSDDVQVTSPKGHGKYVYMPMPGVLVEDAILTHILMVPLTLKNNVLSFSDVDVSYSDACAEIPQTFDDKILEVKVAVDSSDLAVSEKLDEIKLVMTRLSSEANSPIEFVDSGEDLLIELGTSQDAELKIGYFEDQSDASYSWYKRIACYSGKGFEDAKINLGEVGLSVVTEEKIRIDLGKTQDFVKAAEDNNAFTTAIGMALYTSIKRGIED
jgi:hypothetical protein